AFGVHETGIQVAELPFLTAVWCRGGHFHDLAHRLLRLFGQNLKRAVAGPVRGNLGPRKPPPVDVPEQVVLGADAGIEVVDGDTRCERHALSVGPAPAGAPSRPTAPIFAARCLVKPGAVVPAGQPGWSASWLAGRAPAGRSARWPSPARTEPPAAERCSAGRGRVRRPGPRGRRPGPLARTGHMSGSCRTSHRRAVVVAAGLNLIARS